MLRQSLRGCASISGLSRTANGCCLSCSAEHLCPFLAFRNFPLAEASLSWSGYGATMGKRWTDKDVNDLKRLAEHYPAHKIAEILDRSTGAVAFKAHQLKVWLRRRSHLDPGPAGFDWQEL